MPTGILPSTFACIPTCGRRMLPPPASPGHGDLDRRLFGGSAPSQQCCRWPWEQVSPTLFALEVLVLSGHRHPVGRGWAVAGGSAVMLLLYTVLGLTLLEHVAYHRGHSATDATIDLAAALLLGLSAVRALSPRPTVAENHSLKATRMRTSRPVAFWGLGALAMLVNFSTLVLYLAALHQGLAFVGRPGGEGGGRRRPDADHADSGAAARVTGHGARPQGRPGVVPGERVRRRSPREITAGIEIVFCLVLLFKGIGELP